MQKASYIELINLHEHHSFLSVMSFLSDVLKDDDLSRYQSKWVETFGIIIVIATKIDNIIF